MNIVQHKLLTIFAGSVVLWITLSVSVATSSFIITVMLAGVFEVVLIAYFGTLSSKGFIATAVAFGVSSAVTRYIDLSYYLNIARMFLMNLFQNILEPVFNLFL